MDSRGYILTPEQVAAMDAAEQKLRDLIDIPDDQLADVSRMNRHDRRAWHAQQRRALRRAAGGVA